MVLINSMKFCSGKTSKKVNQEGNDANFQSLIDDYDRAEKQIFDAIGNLERNVEKVMEAEVETLFHGLEHHDKVAIKEKAQQAVKKGAKKVKTDVGLKQQPTLPEPFHYPYNWPHEDPEHRLLHAIEKTEKAVLHAVEMEVKGLFHELEHHEHKEALAKGVTKAQNHLDDAHESRRSWFQSRDMKETIEDYMHHCW